MPRNTLAPYPWPCSIDEGYRNGDQRHLMGPCGSRRTLLFYLLVRHVGRELDCEIIRSACGFLVM